MTPISISWKPQFDFESWFVCRAFLSREKWKIDQAKIELKFWIPWIPFIGGNRSAVLTIIWWEESKNVGQVLAARIKIFGRNQSEKTFDCLRLFFIYIIIIFFFYLLLSYCFRVKLPVIFQVVNTLILQFH